MTTRAAAALALLASVGLAATIPAPAQTSQTCEFAVAGWAATQVELAEARRNLRACLRQRQHSCTATDGVVRTLEQRLKLMRNYVDNYCRR